MIGTASFLVSKPVVFRERAFQAKKGFLKGTHRICTPEETWDSICMRPFEFGLTRNATITGLDRIGMPVTIAIRPNGLTLTVSSGKGLTHTAALVSGYMEAYELHHCETYPFPSIAASFEEMSQMYKTPPFSETPMKKQAVIHEKWPLRWVLGWDLITQQEIALPLLAISLDYRLAKSGSFFELNNFERTSNGLASGNHFLEAICAGLYEVIERDAIACHAYTATHYHAPKVILETIPYAAIKKLFEQLQHAQIALELFDCTVDTNVYVFEALVYDNLQRNQGVAKGYGAHLDPEIAILRAITEAVQGRTVYISGARDDIFLSHFQLFRKFDAQRCIERMQAIPSVIDARHYRSEASLTFEEDLQLLIKKIMQAGLEHVVVFDLSFENSPFPVVKVAVPGMEGYSTATSAMGKRARVFAASKKGQSEEDAPLSMWHRPAGEVT